MQSYTCKKSISSKHTKTSILTIRHKLKRWTHSEKGPPFIYIYLTKLLNHFHQHKSVMRNIRLFYLALSVAF